MDRTHEPAISLHRVEIAEIVVRIHRTDGLKSADVTVDNLPVEALDGHHQKLLVETDTPVP